MAAILRGDAVSLRKSLDERFANDCKELLNLKRPSFLTALIAICYGNSFRATDLANSQALQSFARDKLATAGCITLLNMSADMYNSGITSGSLDRTTIVNTVSALTRVGTESNFVMAVIELSQQKTGNRQHLVQRLASFFREVMAEEKRVSEQFTLGEPVSNDLYLVVEVCRSRS